MYRKYLNAGISPGIAFIVLSVALGIAGEVQAENECGRPEAGTPVVCSPSNYDASVDGNIVYYPSKAHGGDFTIHLTDGLPVRYDQDDPDDDQLVFSRRGRSPLQRRQDRDGCGAYG